MLCLTHLDAPDPRLSSSYASTTVTATGFPRCTPVPGRRLMFAHFGVVLVFVAGLGAVQLLVKIANLGVEARLIVD